MTTPSADCKPTGEFAASGGYPSGLERVVESTKDGFDGRGAGGLSEFRAEGVTLILGNCLDYMPIIADAVISDPPYGIAFAHGGGCVTGAARGTRFAGDAIMGDDAPFDPSPWVKYPIAVLWGGNHYASKLPDRACWLVWDKRDGIDSNDQADCELAWTNLRSPARLKRHLWNGMLKDSERGEPRVHPTQKPVVMMAWAMERAKVPVGATVLDPYMGSGTTGIACIRTGRKFIGIESDPRHFETACQRIRRELEECVFELPKGRDGGEQQQALELEPRQTDNAPISDGERRTL